MVLPVVAKVAGVVLALAFTCLTTCAFRVEPVHGWMMRHHCPIAMLTMHRPAHPMGMDSAAREPRARR